MKLKTKMLEQMELYSEIVTTKKQSLDSLYQKSLLIKEKCTDYSLERVTTSNLCLDAFGDEIIFTDVNSDKHQMGISKYAMSQLCSKVGVPSGYYEKCISTGRVDLARDNLHSWIDTFDKNLLVRGYDTSVRGFLSDKYSIFDTHEVLEVLQDVVNPDAYEVKGSFISPERFHLRLTSRELLDIPNEDLYAGILIDSSDVGRSTLRCRFLVYKQVCTNGLIISRNANLFQQKHIGISQDEFKKGLVASLDVIPSLIPEVEKYIITAKKDKGGANWLNTASEDEIQKFVENMKKQTTLSEAHCNNVIEIMKSGRYENNKWGYINSITDVAKGMSLERRLEIENIAGHILVA